MSNGGTQNGEDVRLARLEERVAAQDKAVATAMASAEKAVAKAELANEKRFESVNEFRGTLADQQRDLMPRPEVEVIIKALTEKVDALTAIVMGGTSKREGAREGWQWAIGVVGLILTVLAVVTMLRK